MVNTVWCRCDSASKKKYFYIRD